MHVLLKISILGLYVVDSSFGVNITPLFASITLPIFTKDFFI